MKRLSFALVFCFLFVEGALAQDAEGCKDHPMVSRMPEYYITECSNSYNQIEIVTSVAEGSPQTNAVEGNVTALDYSALPDMEGKLPSWFQVVKNYNTALGKIGGKKVYSDESVASFLVSKQGKDTWVWMELAAAGDHGANLTSFNLKVIQVEAMKQEVSANAMLEELNKSGFVALYFNFESGKAGIKPESQPIVAQIADLLKSNPELSVSIEGHTDNVGTAASNKALSEIRARAVMNAVAGQGIEKSRLSALGWGQEKPVADNRSEDGRAKNRRVEIVKK